MKIELTRVYRETFNTKYENGEGFLAKSQSLLSIKKFTQVYDQNYHNRKALKLYKHISMCILIYKSKQLKRYF